MLSLRYCLQLLITDAQATCYLYALDEKEFEGHVYAHAHQKRRGRILLSFVQISEFRITGFLLYRHVNVGAKHIKLPTTLIEYRSQYSFPTHVASCTAYVCVCVW